MRNIEAQLEARKEHVSRHRKMHIEQRPSSRRAHPIPGVCTSPVSARRPGVRNGVRNQEARLRCMPRSMPLGYVKRSSKSAHLPNKHIPFPRVCKPLASVHNSEVQLEARTKEHASVRCEARIEKHAPSRRVHPIPKSMPRCARSQDSACRTSAPKIVLA